MSADRVIEVEQLGAVRRLWLNRPEKRNALSPELLRALEAEVEHAADDPATSVIVLRGRGAGFSAGFDLQAPSPGTRRDIWSDRERLRRSNRTLESLWCCPLPIIAAVHGFALAGGADLALHCDFLIMADDARIGYPPVRNLGVPPTNLWLYRLGPQRAKRMLLTGDQLSGVEAADLGLALESVASDELDGCAMGLAQRMSLIGRELLIGNKAVVNRGIDLMGRPTLNRIAETEDAMGHVSPPAQAFRAAVVERGLRAALRERDEPFDTAGHGQPPVASLPAELDELRSILAADGFGLEVDLEDRPLRVRITAAAGTCTDCLAPLAVTRSIIAKALRCADDPELFAVEYPPAEPAGDGLT